jgi:hypothetical protein
LRMEDDSSRAVVFEECDGYQRVPPVSIGDLLLVRTARHPDGSKAVMIYDRLETAVEGEISYVDPGTRFAFVRPANGTGDIFLPGNLYEELGSPLVGTRVAVRARATPRKPEATWVIVLG